MQATKPLSTSNPARAGFFAVLAAAVILIVAMIAANLAPPISPTTDTGAGVNSAPLVLDPDARDGVGRNAIGPQRPQ